MKTITVKMADGDKVTHVVNGKKQVYIMTGNAQLWELLGWDVEHDENAKACADIVVRELLCFGYFDISATMPKGEQLIIEIIPVGGWDAEVASGAEIVGEVVR